VKRLTRLPKPRSTGSGSGSRGVCRAPTPVCDSTGGYCVQYEMSTDLHDGARTKCNTTDDECVQCITAMDCATGQTCSVEGICQ
jgi:hypothetical protein